jgi:peptide/nickel transport system permease protein
MRGLAVYAVKRCLHAVAIIALVIAITFTVLHVIPGDPIQVVLGPLATPEIVADYRLRMGLDQPVWIQFGRFFADVVRGDLGTDVLANRGVARSVLEQLPFTLALIATGLAWAVGLGIPLGAYAATHRGSVLDRVLGLLSVSVIAIPSFVVAVYSLLFFAVYLGWFPAIGAGEPGDILDQLYHLVLPSLAIGLGWVGFLARLVRASMLEVLGENHIRTARAFGLPQRLIVRRYALRLAILPTITLLGVGIGHLLSGAVFSEIVFARPGIGKLVYDAINARNYPLVSGAMLVTTAFYVLMTLVSDLVVAGIDPRVRASLG